MRFISHLDMTRFLARAIRRAEIPVWYTEGFNPHLYMTFALPLSLGFESEYEVVDIRITDDSFDIGRLCDRLNSVCGEFMHFYDAAEPVLKTGGVAGADFKITFDDGGTAEKKLDSFLNRKSITVTKKTKKGELKEIEVADKIMSFSTENVDGNTVLKIRLPAGSVENLNPELILNRFFAENDEYYNFIINRTAILDADGNLFK